MPALSTDSSYSPGAVPLSIEPLELLMFFFVTWASVVYGLTMIVTVSKLFAPLRDALPKVTAGEHVSARTFLGTLLRCPMCFGWWVGAGFAALGYSPVLLWHDPILRSLPRLEWLFSIVASGCMGSAVCWTWYVVLAKLGSRDL